MRIPQDLLNWHTNKIWFDMNIDHTFVRPRDVDPKKFHTPPLLYYLDEETLDKEVCSWPGVKREKKKSGISYQFPAISQWEALA
jgi:hypothetical protein